MSILEARNLYYSYDKRANALTDVNLSIERGQVTAVLGGNGAGKSTLFLNLNGVFTPNQGQVLLDGKVINHDRAGLKELRRRVGIVFQDPNDQLFSASVRNDIAFGALNLGLPEANVSGLVAEAAAQTGVTALLDRPTHALSFGQKKRVALAGILITRPDVIILDEPTAGLDPAGVSDILALLTRIKQESGASVIISTHDIDLVPLYCDYAYVLREGRICLQGRPRELFRQRETLRQAGLRLPRIGHLMEILRKEDGLDIDDSAATIAEARAAIKNMLKIGEKL